MKRIPRRGIGLLIAALGLVVLPGTAVAGNASGINVTVPNAKAAISGKVTRHGGGAVKNAAVYLVDPDFGFPNDFTYTDSAGKFTFYDKFDDTFLISVDPHATAPTYASGFYRKNVPDNFTTSQATATVVHYTGTLIKNINIAVPLGHSIKGKVRRQTGGAPIKGVGVRAVSPTTGANGSAITDGSGNYTIPGLPNQSYRLTFTPGGTTNSLDGCYRVAPPHNYTADCSNNASNVAVNNANVSNKNIDLPDGRRITGKVKDAQGHNLCATVTAVSMTTFAAAAESNTCGSFTLVGLSTGNYRIDVVRRGTSHFVNGHYATNAHHWVESGSIEQVHVGNANVSLGTIQPDLGHIISGTIKNPANKGVKNANVFLGGSNSSYDYATTDAQGRFTFHGVGSGTHTIQETAGFSGQNIRSGYYRTGATGSWTANEGQATRLSANANHSGIVIKPAKGFSISGQITNSAHKGVRSYVFGSGGGSGSAFSDAQGHYAMTGLNPGDYVINVSPGSSATAHYKNGYYKKTAPGHFTDDYVEASKVHVGP